MPTKIWLLTSLLVSGLLLGTTGCVCVTGSGECGAIGCAGSPCDSCASPNEFYAGGPLSGIVGWNGAAGCNSCSSGCGEMYVDEWLNEPPVVDNCGCGECRTCGRQPIRSLLRILWGDSYCGSCETHCDGEIGLAEPIINDGYDPQAWSANRGCNCGGGQISGMTLSEGPAGAGPSPIESATPLPPVPVPDAVGEQPTPAPPTPKSAMRLNPATRRLVR